MCADVLQINTKWSYWQYSTAIIHILLAGWMWTVNAGAGNALKFKWQSESARSPQSPRSPGCRNALEDRDWPPPNIIIVAWDLNSPRCSTWSSSLEHNFGSKSASVLGQLPQLPPSFHQWENSMGFSNRFWTNPPGQRIHFNHVQMESCRKHSQTI